MQWNNENSKFEEGGLLKSKKDCFKKATNLNFIYLHVPFILGNSEEFNLIQEPHIKSEITLINNLYDKYKSIFKNKDILESIGYKIPLNKKKAIGIAFEYSFGDRKDKNYLKLHKINEYVILIAKLLNSFIDIQKEKYFQLKILKKIKKIKKEIENNKEISELTQLQPIKFDFIFSLLFYQQCFYQGIPIFKEKYIPFIHLPHISLKNDNILKEKDIDMTLEQFLKYGDEGKKTIIQNIFNYNDIEIKDIIESAKGIPQYEYKLKSFVDGFEDTGFLKGDKVTFKLDIFRKNKENKNYGVLHSKCFPGLFKELIYITIKNNNNIIRQAKVFINFSKIQN